jgi:hypothetical protein
MRSPRRAPIIVMAMAAIAVLLVGEALADDMIMGGTFTMNYVSGSPGEDLLVIVGNENSWMISLHGAELVCTEEMCTFPPSGSIMLTTLHAASFEFQFFGPDAALLNDQVADQLTQGGLTTGGFFEVAADDCSGPLILRYFFYIWPDVPSEGVYWSVDGVGTLDVFPFDQDGCPIVEPFELDATQTILFDRRGENDGYIAALDASTIWLEMGTPVSPATWSTVKALYR